MPRFGADDSGDDPGRARRPAGVDRDSDRRARRRALDRRRQRRRRQLALAHHFGRAERGQTLGPQRLLGLALGGERHQHRARASRQHVQHRVVAGLTYRHPASAQQRREIGRESFDDDPGGRVRAQRREFALRQIGAGQQQPRQVGQAPGAARRQRRFSSACRRRRRRPSHDLAGSYDDSTWPTPSAGLSVAASGEGAT